ncbi:MAG TPA: response regulator transcription factor [Polyangiaceae bacterium]
MGEARFLFVDDDLDVCRAMARLVRPHGEPVCAATVAEAEEQLRGDGEWSGFVLDVGLPDGSGLELLTRARHRHALTPALVLTGHVDGDLINRAYDLGAEYVVKPIDRERLGRFLRMAASLRPRTSLPSRVDRVVSARAAAVGLSETEADVLRRSALGESRQEIARARGTSEQTIRTQIGRMLAKTGDGSLLASIGNVLREVARSTQ